MNRRTRLNKLIKWKKKVNQLCNSRTDHIICKKIFIRYLCRHQNLKNFTLKNSLRQTKIWDFFFQKNELQDILKKNTFLLKCTKCLMPGFKPVITGWQDRRLTRFSQSSSEISMENLPIEITDVNWNNKGIMSWLVHPLHNGSWLRQIL